MIYVYAKSVVNLMTCSLSAVRFGRIPKREKQRMLLEMQNAMNNMMSNNSQLHSMLQGHQSPPLPMEAMTSDSNSFPSSSSSSSASDSPSCSNPSSPQCPQDSESVVSMDTTSSSSCSSDSGEDEALVTLNRQHRDALAFTQQRSPTQGQTSPATVSVETGCESRMEKQQDRWNCWNNSVAVRDYQNCPYSSGQQVTNPAYRGEREGYQQQFNSTPSCEQSEDSQRQQTELHTQSASNGYNGPTNCVNNRAHLVSDFIFRFLKF